MVALDDRLLIVGKDSMMVFWPTYCLESATIHNADIESTGFDIQGLYHIQV